jgi:hypothetical protein
VSKSLFSIAAFLLCLAASLPAVAGNAPSQPLNVAGRWNVSWQARLGTEQAEVELQQDGSKLSGTFHDPHHTCVLSGTIEGKSVSFNVNFTGPRPYTIAFKGTLDGDKRLFNQNIPGRPSGRQTHQPCKVRKTRLAHQAIPIELGS